MAVITYREAVRAAMSEEMRRSDTVFIMGEDIADMGGSQGVTQGMLKEFGPERVRNTPISEEAVVGAAIGSAMTGMRPIVEIMYLDFMAMAMDQVFNQAAKWRYMTGGQVTLPLTIRTQGGAGWQSGAQHATMVEAWVHPHSRPEGRHAVAARRREAVAEGSDSRRESRALHRAPRLLRPQGRGQ